MNIDVLLITVNIAFLPCISQIVIPALRRVVMKGRGGEERKIKMWGEENEKQEYSAGVPTFSKHTGFTSSYPLGGTTSTIKQVRVTGLPHKWHPIIPLIVHFKVDYANLGLLWDYCKTLQGYHRCSWQVLRYCILMHILAVLLQYLDSKWGMRKLVCICH